MRRYTLGFLYDEAFRVALVRKRTGPGGQKGKLNGFGGKVEPRESIKHCMHREFLEESGWPGVFPNWRPFFVMQSEDFFLHPDDRGSNGPLWKVHCFWAQVGSFCPFIGREQVEVFPIEAVPGPTVKGVRDLLKMSVEDLRRVMDGVMDSRRA